MGVRVALGEMFPLTAMCPRMWSYLILLVYLIQLVKNSSSSDGALQDTENITSLLHLLQSTAIADNTPEVSNTTPSLFNSSSTGVVSSTAENSNSEVTARDTNNYTILKNKVKTLDKELNKTLLYNVTVNFTDYENDVSNTLEGAPRSTTRRPIYIRGHLLRAHHKGRTFYPAIAPLNDNSQAHRAHFKDARADPLGREACGKGKQCRQSSEPNIINHIGNPARRQKKHSTKNGRKKFYNYKLLYDTIRTKDNLNQRETEFYAWIFGASMLTLGGLTTIASCFAFCFCGDKWRKRRDQRRRLDKSGEYQRVDSVSSIVDNANHYEDLYEDQIDNVTII